MIRARQTCFCGLFRSATTAANRSRSAALTSILIPWRMLHYRIRSADMELYDGVRPTSRDGARCRISVADRAGARRGPEQRRGIAFPDLGARQRGLRLTQE